MKRQPLFRTLFWLCYLPLAGGVTGGLLAYHRVMVKGEHVSHGRLFAGVEPPRSPFNTDYCGTKCDLILSGKLQTNAFDKLDSPAVIDQAAKLRVEAVQPEGSAVMHVSVFHPDQDYAQRHLQALMEEYVAFREQMMVDAIHAGALPDTVADEVCVILAPASAAVRHYPSLAQLAGGGLAGAFFAGLAALFLAGLAWALRTSLLRLRSRKVVCQAKT